MSTAMVTWRIKPGQKQELIRRQKETFCATLSEYLARQCFADPVAEQTSTAIYVDRAAVAKLASEVGKLADQYRRAGINVNQIAKHLNEGGKLGIQIHRLNFCVSEFLRGQKTLDEIRDRLLELTKIPGDPYDSEKSTNKPLA